MVRVIEYTLHEVGFKEGDVTLSKFGPMVPQNVQEQVLKALDDVKTGKVTFPEVQ